VFSVLGRIVVKLQIAHSLGFLDADLEEKSNGNNGTDSACTGNVALRRCAFLGNFLGFCLGHGFSFCCFSAHRRFGSVVILGQCGVVPAWDWLASMAHWHRYADATRIAMVRAWFGVQQAEVASRCW
jgi:hypothetical protein